MKFDRYNLLARVFPACIILIPFILFFLNCRIEGLNSVFEGLLQVRVIGTLTLSVILLYFFVQINRFLGKFFLERKLFKNELEFPTTTFLLHSDINLSDTYKEKIRDKVLTDFNISFPGETEETEEPSKAKRRIAEIVGLIRQKVKKGQLLSQHNIEYGFARNLIAGTTLGLPMSIFNIFYFFTIDYLIVAWLNVCLVLSYGLLLFFNKAIIKHLGNQYAKLLFQEYLQL